MARLLPRGAATFVVEVPGGRVRLRYQEVLGVETFIAGGFERAELETLRAMVRRGTVAVDVGANVGLFTVSLASPATEVWAFDPLPENAQRIRENAGLNGFENVKVFEVAVGETDGQAVFNLAWDPAFGSTLPVVGGNAAGRSITVPAVRLDSEWERAGRPPVSVMKVDVEGAEYGVLRGARQLVETCLPVLLVEARDDERLAALTAFLSPLGYARRPVAGFAPGNHLFYRDP